MHGDLSEDWGYMYNTDTPMHMHIHIHVHSLYKPGVGTQDLSPLKLDIAYRVSQRSRCMYFKVYQDNEYVFQDVTIL